MEEKYASFKKFYPYYLSEHVNPMCRKLHFLGTLGVIILIIISYFNTSFLLLVPLCGYGFAWIGHFFFEKNQPATFKYPIYSLIGDWVMFKDIIIGKELLNPNLTKRYSNEKN